MAQRNSSISYDNDSSNEKGGNNSSYYSMASATDDRSGRLRKRNMRKSNGGTDMLNTSSTVVASVCTSKTLKSNEDDEDDSVSDALSQSVQRLRCLDVESVFESNMFLRYARAYPLVYLQVIGHSLVMTEMIAVLTPAVAIGLQWMTALCPGTVSESILGLLTMAYMCLVHQECHATSDCIVGDFTPMAEVAEALANLPDVAEEVIATLHEMTR
jgi:hypothetical protein